MTDLNSLLLQEHTVTIARQEERIQKLEEANVRSSFLLFGVLTQQQSIFIKSLQIIESTFISLPIEKKREGFDLLYPTFSNILNQLNSQQYGVVCSITLDFASSVVATSNGELISANSINLHYFMKLFERLKVVLNKNATGGDDGLIKNVVLKILSQFKITTILEKAFEIYCFVIAKRKFNTEEQNLEAIRALYSVIKSEYTSVVAQRPVKNYCDGSKIVSILLDIFQESVEESKERCAIAIGFILADKDLTQLRFTPYNAQPGQQVSKYPVYTPVFPQTVAVVILGFINGLSRNGDESWQCVDSTTVVQLLRRNNNNKLVLDSL